MEKIILYKRGNSWVERDLLANCRQLRVNSLLSVNILRDGTFVETFPKYSTDHSQEGDGDEIDIYEAQDSIER